MGGDGKLGLQNLAFLDLSGLEQALRDVSELIDDQDKAVKLLASRLAQVERVAFAGKEKNFLEEKVEDLVGRMLVAEEGIRDQQSKTEDLDEWRNRIKSVEEEFPPQFAKLQTALQTGMKSTREHVDEQTKRLKNQISLGEAKVSEVSQRFETLRTDVEDCALNLKQQGKKLDEVEENALLAVAHGGMISDLRARLDNVKEVCESDLAATAAKLRVKADQAVIEAMRKDLEQSNNGILKQIESIPKAMDKFRERFEQHSSHLEGHDTTLEAIHADIRSLRNVKAAEVKGAPAAGTAHCLSCYGARPQSPPRIQKGIDGATYHGDNIASDGTQRGVQIQGGRVKPPRTVPSIPCATRELIPQQSPFEAQKRALASAAEKANWSRSNVTSGSRPGSATLPGTQKRLSRPSTAQSYRSMSSDRSVPLLERIDWSEQSEQVFLDDI